ncbi:MAG: peptidylprolyl isomerase [Anaerorhabdus sp.]
MSNVLKKYGAVIVVGIFFLGIIIFTGLDQAKNTISGKKENGEDVIFSISDNNITANEYYDEMYKIIGDSTLVTLFETSVADQVVETTDEIKETAKILAENAKSGYISQYGEEEARAKLTSILKSYGFNDGFDDLEDYFLINIKSSKIAQDYIDKNPDKYITPYMEESKPRLLSHILISMVDPENPTEEELAKQKAVEDALAGGKSFEEVAVEYSDDTASATQNGYLGLSDANTSYVPEFLEASLNLKENEISEWIKTDYGYHMIRCDADTFESINAKEEGTIYESILNNDPTIRSYAFWEKAQELNITFASDDIKNSLLKALGIEEGEK